MPNSHQLTLSQVVSLASQLAELASGRLRAMNDGYGLNLPEPFASYDPVSHSLKTSQVSLIGDLAMYSATWPAAGMMLNGNCYRLPLWVRRIFGRGSGLWPTLLKGDSANRLTSKRARRLYSAGESLIQFVRRLEDRSTGALNPAWCEWWMGFPMGWVTK